VLVSGGGGGGGGGVVMLVGGVRVEKVETQTANLKQKSSRPPRTAIVTEGARGWGGGRDGKVLRVAIVALRYTK